MHSKPQTYPAVYIIFTLLHALRRGSESKNIWREFRRQGIALRPRLSFWLALCRQAGLLKPDAPVRVASYARQWLNKPPDEQALLLIEAWQNAPKNHKSRQFRKKLLWKLKYDKALTPKDLGAIHGLDALGLTADGRLTRWGSFFINPARTAKRGFEACGVRGEGKAPTPKPSAPCKIHEDHFFASIPQHADLLWELETHLRPSVPGQYPLTRRALHFHEGDPYRLIELIERGLQAEIPERTKALILDQPSIRIAEGIVLEFSSPAELKQLRRQPVFRKYIDEFLSPQRILVSNEKASGLFQMLKRRGVYAHREPGQARGRQKRTHFPSTPGTPPKPVGAGVPKLTVIEKYKQLGQALDIFYRAPGYPAEKRRITPLLIEERGEHTYVIAYCQTRRAQRTFRLDRIEVPGTW